MEEEFERIVEKLKTFYGERKRYSVTPIKDCLGVEVSAVDGGCATLWTNNIFSIGILRFGYVLYNENHRIKKVFVKDEPVFFEGDFLDFLRFEREVETIFEASKKCKFVMYDGALMDVPKTKFKTLKELECDVVGVSKKTQINFLREGISDSEAVDSEGIWYYKIPETFIDSKYKRILLGEIYVAKLHEAGNPFRIDVLGENPSKIFRILSHFSKYHLCLGYPYPLLEIHRIVNVSDKIQGYDSILRKVMFKMGLEKEYFQGKIEREKRGGDFHSVLDSIV